MSLNTIKWLVGLSLLPILIACNSSSSSSISSDGGITPSGESPVAVKTLNHTEQSDGVTLQAAGYTLDVIIPPSQIISAPFDTTVLPDGRIVIQGNDGTLKSVADDGTVAATGYVAGMNFDTDSSGTMWSYNWVSGAVFSGLNTGTQNIVATLPSVYTDGSIAASPDGQTVYIGWWKIDYDLNTRQSALYRYTAAGGLVKVLDGTSDSVISAVEVTASGDLYMAMTDGIYHLDGSDNRVLFASLSGQSVHSDALTSDAAGNLYYAVQGTGMGVYKVTPSGYKSQIVSFSDSQDLPFGLSWDENNQRIVGVRKEKGELVTISLTGAVTVLNSPSGLTTPIAIEEHPSGSIFVNGDEAGLLLIEGDNSVTSYKSGITSYQPPAADFAFNADGLAYYTYAAPGFDSKIVTINSTGSVSEISRDPAAPAGIEITSDGSIYYNDYEGGAIMQLNNDGSSSSVLDGIQNPVGLAVDTSGYFWVGVAHDGALGDPTALNEVYNKKILRFRPGESVEEIINFDDSEWHTLTFFDVDQSGNLYLPDGNRLLIRGADGSLTTIADGFGNIRGATVASDGRIYFVDYERAALYRLNVS